MIMTDPTDGTGSGPKGLTDLIQTAQKMQQELGKVQQELADKTVEGSAGGGMVVAVANGRQQLVSIHIEEEVVDPQEIEMLQDLVLAAVNQALSNAAELAQQEMARATGQMNLNITGLF
jgi:DNA-binding YbaB/EbfC family protein